jgi:hypothetical protein
MTQKKQKAKIGDIIAIPIYPENFVFGRLLEDASIEVFSRISESPNMPDDLTLSKVILSAGFFDKKIKAGEWQVVGRIDFASEDEKWPPPSLIIDDISPDNVQIYHKGEIRSATKSEAHGLEEQFMYKPEQLIEEVKSRLNIQTSKR